MNMKEKLPKIEEFLAKVINEEFDGVYYMPLGKERLYLVACKDEDKETIAKIAYNCDDLQCDYELDWNMPVYKDGEVAFVETTLDKKNIKVDAKWFYKEFKAMVREIKARNLLLEEPTAYGI